MRLAAGQEFLDPYLLGASQEASQGVPKEAPKEAWVRSLLWAIQASAAAGRQALLPKAESPQAEAVAPPQKKPMTTKLMMMMTRRNSPLVQAQEEPQEEPREEPQGVAVAALALGLAARAVDPSARVDLAQEGL